MKRLVASWLVALAVPAAARADALSVSVRGRSFHLPYEAALPPAERVPVLFLPGDGGWRGFAVTIARRMAASGYDVYGLDTREYLEAFTGPTVLTVRQIGEDLGAVAGAIGNHRGGRVTLVGWSEGAALAIAAAATNPDAFSGIVVFGVPERAALAWRLRDSLASLAGREPDEPHFEVAPLLSRLADVPIVMIQATGDPYTPVDRARALFDRAPSRKRLQFVDARNHRFDGGTETFFAALVDGIGWVQTGGGGLSAARRRTAPWS
jgi:pimeloyl-ACP methyl ester carboxylesterase